MTKFRFHVVSLPHTQTSKKHCACALTMKVYNFCKMMRKLGHTVYHYGTNGSDPVCNEHVTIIRTDEQKELIGDNDFTKELYKITYDANLPYWRLANCRAVAEIKKRMEPHDFLCLIGGHAQKPIADALPSLMAVEYGVGYTGIFTKYRVFEAYTHMHRMYGNMGGDRDGSFYDCVIPCCFDPADFPLGKGEGDYCLYVGRIVARKGLQVAVHATRVAGQKLLVVGQGVDKVEPGIVHGSDGMKYEGDHVEFLGYVDIKKRSELMGAAKAVFVPTMYLEPFGAVAVEAQLCGTPVLSTDWGGFPETVQHGVTGYRCHTLDQFAWAAKNAHLLDRKRIRDLAVANYSLDRIGQMYQEYFEMLYDLWDKGWYQVKERKEMDWLRKEF